MPGPIFNRTRTKSTTIQALVLVAIGCLFVGSSTTVNAASAQIDYRILATSRTSTMEKELNDAARDGYRFSKVMGGKTVGGGNEVVIAMLKRPAPSDQAVSHYKLLATQKTSTMQKEIQKWADEGYDYLDQTVFETAFGGKEVVVIMEQEPGRTTSTSLYRLLATSKTSTMEKELKDAGQDGFLLVGFTVGKTAMGGEEIVSILRKN